MQNAVCNIILEGLKIQRAGIFLLKIDPTKKGIKNRRQRKGVLFDTPDRNLRGTVAGSTPLQSSKA